MSNQKQRPVVAAGRSGAPLSLYLVATLCFAAIVGLGIQQMGSINYSNSNDRKEATRATVDDLLRRGAATLLDRRVADELASNETMVAELDSILHSLGPVRLMAEPDCKPEIRFDFQAWPLQIVTCGVPISFENASAAVTLRWTRRTEGWTIEYVSIRPAVSESQVSPI
jgi:hypothetical protein